MCSKKPQYLLLMPFDTPSRGCLVCEDLIMGPRDAPHVPGNRLRNHVDSVRTPDAAMARGRRRYKGVGGAS